MGTEGITGGGMYGNGGEDSFVGYDFGKIFPAGQHWGVYFQHYPQIEYLRSFASADSVRFTYTQPFEEYPGGYFRDAWTNEKVNRFVPWYDLLNGMNGTMYWGSLGTDWYAFYSADYRPTPWSKQIAETIQEINRGVGKLLVAGVTWRLAGAGYFDFGLGTEDFRLAAISIYFSLGYVPVLDSPDAAERWRAVCIQIERPFEPEKWFSRPVTQAG